MKKANLLEVKNLVLALLIAIVLFGLWGVMSPLLTETGDDAACRASVIANVKTAQVQDYATQGKRFFSLNCKRHQLRVSQSDVEQDRVNRGIGSRLYKCWNNMLGGETDQFAKNLLQAERSVCLVCAEISFANDIESSELASFEAYIKDKEADGETIWNSVYKGRLNKSTPVLERSGNEWTPTTLKPSKDYTMVYQAVNPAVFDVSLGPFLKETEPSATIMIVPGEDVNNLKCDYFYN